MGSDSFCSVGNRQNRDFNPRSPCGERHRRTCNGRRHSVYFNPRSPCGERPGDDSGLVTVLVFQSTLPVWGATNIPVTAVRVAADFNPRSPCGERLCAVLARHNQRARFQSTLPVWGATRVLPLTINGNIISIHAPRVGSDPVRSDLPIADPNFNPRSPCGERRKLFAKQYSE